MPDIPVSIDFVVEWTSSVILEIALIWGSLNTKNQRKMGFLGKFSGGSRGNCQKSCFWLIFGIWLLSFS